jgi:hypothetical protein
LLQNGPEWTESGADEETSEEEEFTRAFHNRRRRHERDMWSFSLNCSTALQQHNKTPFVSKSNT